MITVTNKDTNVPVQAQRQTMRFLDRDVVISFTKLPLLGSMAYGSSSN